jgi:hypothetical protein
MSSVSTTKIGLGLSQRSHFFSSRSLSRTFLSTSSPSTTRFLFLALIMLLSATSSFLVKRIPALFFSPLLFFFGWSAVLRSFRPIILVATSCVPVIGSMVTG